MSTLGWLALIWATGTVSFLVGCWWAAAFSARDDSAEKYFRRLDDEIRLRRHNQEL